MLSQTDWPDFPMPSAGFCRARVLSELLRVEQCRQLLSAQQSSKEQIRCLFMFRMDTK